MGHLSLREKAIKLVFKIPEDILQETIDEWEATLEILNDKAMMDAFEQGKKEIKNGKYDKLENVEKKLFGNSNV